MKAFEFDDYRKFIRFRVETNPRKGHGQYKKIAEYLDIPTSLVSQIMSGRRELSPESASLIGEYFGLPDLEAEYFLGLVDLSRAGNPSLRNRIRKRLADLRTKGLELATRIPHEKKLSEREMLQFYSQWYFSAIRLMTSIPGKNSADKIAQSLKLPVPLVSQVLEFLVSAGLCLEDRGVFKIGPLSTHVGNDSPMVNRHHLNWRLKVMNELSTPKAHEIVFTGPVTLSQEAAIEIRKRILNFIDEWGQIADSAKEEKLVCLNIDWVDIA